MANLLSALRAAVAHQQAREDELKVIYLRALTDIDRLNEALGR